MTSSRRAYGRLVWLRDTIPTPLWSSAVDFTERRRFDGGAFDTAVAVTQDAMLFLETSGMRVLAEDGEALRRDREVVFGWAGERIAVLAALWRDARLAFLVIDVAVPPVSVAQLIRGARRRTPVTVGFGGFWLAGTDRLALEAEIGGYVDLLRAALGPDPDRVDLGELAPALRAHDRRIAFEREVPWLRGEVDDAWQTQRWARHLWAAKRLDAWGEPVAAERAAYARAQLGGPSTPPVSPPTVDGILAGAAWVEAVTDGPWVPDAGLTLFDAYDDMVTDELGDAIARLRAGDPTAVEPALVFLEADPWAFRTGYLKQTIMTRLRRCPMTADQQARLRTVLLHLVDVGFRWEFREACRLAWRVADPPFMDALRARSKSSDWRVGERATGMLAAIRPPAGT